MGASALPPSGSPPFPFLPDWLNSDYLFTQALTRELSSTSGSSSCSSSSPALDPADFNAFLHNNPGLHCGAQTPLPQVGSPMVSSNSVSKEKPESPFNSSSAPQHFQRGFDQLCSNSIVKPTEENSSSCITSLLSAADAAAAMALSSSRSLGAGATKVRKRRPQINKKAPIRVLSADATNFRDMVQKLTGIPTSRATPQSWGTSTAPLLRPQPTRLGYGMAMPTLDTSACFLNAMQVLPSLQGAPLPLMNGLLSRVAAASKAEGLVSNGGRCNKSSHGAYASHPSVPGLWDPVGSAKSMGSLPKRNLKELVSTDVGKGDEQAFLTQPTTLLERFLMSDDAQSPQSNVDSWLVLDG